MHVALSNPPSGAQSTRHMSFSGSEPSPVMLKKHQGTPFVLDSHQIQSLSSQASRDAPPPVNQFYIISH